MQKHEEAIVKTRDDRASRLDGQASPRPSLNFDVLPLGHLPTIKAFTEPKTLSRARAHFLCFCRMDPHFYRRHMQTDCRDLYQDSTDRLGQAKGHQLVQQQTISPPVSVSVSVSVSASVPVPVCAWADLVASPECLSCMRPGACCAVRDIMCMLCCASAHHVHAVLCSRHHVHAVRCMLCGACCAVRDICQELQVFKME